MTHSVMKEFELIKQYFAQQPVQRKDVDLGIGDDCAIIKAVEGKQIAVTTDTLVAGVHFPDDTSPRAIGHKVLAVSLSDLAAMGAEPCWASLAITLPKIDEHWVGEFCAGLFELCEYYNVQLIGGDTTQGPLSITVTAQGLVPTNKYLSRSGAKLGDWLYVTGQLGDAALALRHLQGDAAVEEVFVKSLKTKLDFPKPRVLAGQTLRIYASSAIDVSDGLLADLGHICARSNLGAQVHVEKLPISTALRESLPKQEAYELALTGGDDYELLFSVSEDKKVGMETAMANAGIDVTCIGQLTPNKSIALKMEGQPFVVTAKGFEHFAAVAE